MLNLKTILRLSATAAAFTIAGCEAFDDSSPDEALGEGEAAITDPNDTSPIVPPPRNLSLGSVTPESMKLFFKCGTHATFHEVVRRVQGGPEEQVAGLAACQAQSTVSVIDDDIQPGLSYCYMVRASNSENAAASETLCQVAPLDFRPPTAPTGSVTDVSQHSAKLVFKDKSDNEGGFVAYGRKVGDAAWTEIGAFPRGERAHRPVGESFSVVRTGLELDTEYEFRVRVYHDYAPMSVDLVLPSFRTLPNPPSKPTGVHVTAVTSSAISLAWKDASGEESYRVEKTEGIGSFDRTVGADATSTTFNGVTQGTKYCFRVSAVNRGGVASATPVCTTTPSAPQTFNLFLVASPPPIGRLAYDSFFGPISNGKLTGLEVADIALNHSDLTGFIFIRPGAPGSACDDPSNRVVVQRGDTMSGSDMAKLYGSSTPALNQPVFVRGCPMFSTNVPTSVTPVITAHFVQTAALSGPEPAATDLLSTDATPGAASAAE